MVGCLPNESVAMYAVDSLRQLSSKFLAKTNSPVLTTSGHFLSPFVVMMEKSASESLKELILHCIQNMMRARGGNIKSGWQSILRVLSLASQSGSSSIVALAFAIVGMIRDNNLSDVASFRVEFVACLVNFASNNSEDCEPQAVAAINMLETCASEVVLTGDKSEYVPLVVALAKGLAVLIGDGRKSVRTRGVGALFRFLSKLLQDGFDGDGWTELFRFVLLRIFDKLGAQDDAGVKAESVEDAATLLAGSISAEPVCLVDNATWQSSTCTVCLGRLVALLVELYDAIDARKINCEIVPDFISTLERLVRSDTEFIVRVGTDAFGRLLNSAGGYFDEDTWHLACDRIRSVLLDREPKELISNETYTALNAAKIGSDVVIVVCRCCVRCLKTTRAIITAMPMPAGRTTPPALAQARTRRQAPAPAPAPTETLVYLNYYNGDVRCSA